MLQGFQPSQRGKIVGIGVEQLQVFQIFAVRQRSEVTQRVHCDNQHLQIRHIPDKREVRNGFVVTDVQILDLGKIFEHLKVTVVQRAAERRFGGENLDHIGSGTVGGAKINAPYDFGIRQRVTDRSHILISDAAAVHQKCLQVRHALGDGEYFRPVFPYGVITDIHFLIFQGKRKLKNRKVIVNFDIGRGFAQREDFLPAWGVFALFVAQADFLQVPQRRNGIQGRQYFFWRYLGQVQSGFVQNTVFSEQFAMIGKIKIRIPGKEFTGCLW